MHETVICKKVQDDAARLCKGKTIKSITLSIGELGPLPPTEIKKHLSLLTSWNVIVNEEKAIALCDCGFKGRPTILERGHDYCLYLCPDCGRVPTLTKGTDIIIAEVRY